MSFSEVALDALIEPAPLERAGGRDMPILSMTMHEGLVDQASKFKKRVASTDTADYKLVRRNQLVVGFPIDEGVLSFQDLYDAAIVSPAYDIWNLRRSHEIEPAYLERFLRSPRALAFYRTKLRGTTARRRTLPDDIFLKLPVPLPLPAEQRRIAAILDKADELRAKRRAALATLDTLTQSIFLDMFGDPVTNPKEWPSVAMATLFAAPPVFGTMIPPIENGGSWLSLRVANIQDWQLDLTDRKFVELPAAMLERHSVRDGDVLLARAIASQEHLGKAVVVYPNGQHWAFDSHLMRLRLDPEKAEPEFLRHLLRTTGGRRLFLKAARRSAVQFNINTKEIAALRIPVAPISMQRSFVDRINALETLKTTEHGSLDLLTTLFATAQHRAFRGEL